MRILLICALLVPITAAAQSSGQTALLPSIEKIPDPNFSAQALSLELEGEITVQVFVDETGKAKVGKIAGPGPNVCSNYKDERVKMLRDAAAEAARNATYRPPTKYGQPVASTAFLYFTVLYPKPASPSVRQGKIVKVDGVINGRARSLPRPNYPSEARATHVAGLVMVLVVIDENGNVMTAYVTGGAGLLRASAVDAACHARFDPTKIQGVPVRVTGTITYNFIP